MTDHEAVVNLIQWFYTEIKHIKPDRSQFGQEYKRIQAFMFPSEEMLRGYTLEQLQAALVKLDEAGVIMVSLSIIYYPGLIAALVDGNAIVARHLINKIVDEQQEKGMSYHTDMPSGW